MSAASSRRPSSERGAANIGDMTSPISGSARAKLRGVCPDNQRCPHTPSCSHLCSRLQGAEIAEEMRQSARLTRLGAGSVAHVEATSPTHQEEDPVEPDATPDTEPDPETGQGFGECKIDDCDEPAAAKAGRYARLCVTHAAEAKARAPKPRRLSGHARARKAVKPPPAARNGNPSARSKLEVLHDLTVKSAEIEKLKTQLDSREQEFAVLADEFAKAKL